MLFVPRKGLQVPVDTISGPWGQGGFFIFPFPGLVPALLPGSGNPLPRLGFVRAEAGYDKDILKMFKVYFSPAVKNRGGFRQGRTGSGSPLSGAEEGQGKAHGKLNPCRLSRRITRRSFPDERRILFRRR